ncbi:deoxyribose-phosphate aldolase [Amedibacterium intestinale]|uniref:deoxyribose-phosphate aldolase n=1 Tax=Amedibacterium intestinale TaxID=2583452 RepID=UPI000E20C069
MKLNKYIDHTLLKADATQDKIETLCKEAKEYDFASICVNTYWVPFCAKQLEGSDVKVCTVVGFPLGAMSSNAKAFETKDAIEHGASEIDMVLNIGEMKAGHYDVVREDVKAVVEAANGHCVKVILETCLLTKEEIVKACELCIEAGATFVKTSTGFSTRGATVEDVKLMKETVKDKCLVKAAGGVRCRADLDNMIEAGADRIGTSAGVALMQDKTNTSDY